MSHPTAHPTVLNLTLIAPDRSEFHTACDPDAIERARGDWPLLWLDCVGLADVAAIARIGELFGLHPLALEDAVNTDQRPKTDFYHNGVFVVVSMIDDRASRRREQISLFFGERFVVTFQERPGDPFEPVRRRIKGQSPLCERNSDYLAYALIDAIVDSYFPVMEHLGEAIDGLEDAIFAETQAPDIRELHMLRRGVAGVKRSLWPLRDALAALARAETTLVAAETKIYLNDTLDHVVRLIEMTEADREMLTGLIEIDLALAQGRANDVVRFLTVVSAIFIPLTFIVGVWGMNFDPNASPWNMPELQAWFGYPAALLFMAAVATGLIVYFRRKKWL